MVLGSLPASAQDDRPVQFSLGGGWTFANAEVRDHFGDGYNFNVGLTFAVSPSVAIETLYSFNGMGDKDINLPVSINPLETGVPTPFTADMNMQFGTASVVFRKPDGGVRPYGLVGLGVYYRPVKVTTPGVGFVPGYCDPYWYYCSPGGFVPVENIIGDRSSTDFGMNFGAGITFSRSFYVEMRYHYIWGPTFDATAVGGSASQKANGQFLPITVGFRF